MTTAIAQALSATDGNPAPGAATTRPARRASQMRILAVLAALVIGIDQTLKWWAWRHSAGTIINAGGDELVGQQIGSWYQNPIGGAALDVADSFGLACAVYVLARRRRPWPVIVSVGLFLAGWTSNVLDRLGLHYWTAPGSVRGAIDFIPIGNNIYNAADLSIVAGAVGFGACLLAYGRRGVVGAPAAALATRAVAVGHRSRAALAGAGAVVTLALIGVIDYGGVYAPFSPGAFS